MIFCMMNRILTITALLCTPLLALTEYPDIETAREDGRCIMLNFTGTDWCTACIHLKTKILDSPAFNSAMGDKLVLVEVDFPRSPELVKQISIEERKKRETLLTGYRADALPYAVLLDSRGFPFATLPGTTQTAEEYIKRIEKAFDSLSVRDAAMKKATTLTGMDKARALAEALNQLPEVCRDKYRDTVQTIVSLDKDNTLGYQQVVQQREARINQMNELNELLASFRENNSHEAIKHQISELDQFLSRPELDADVRQLALRSKSDCYAFLRDIPNMLKFMKESHAVNPESRLGKKLKINILYTETHLLPQYNRQNTDRLPDAELK